MNGVQLKIGDEFVEMEGAALTIEISTGIYSLEQPQRAASFPFRLPHTPHNARLLKHYQVIGRSGSKGVGLTADLYIQGIYYLRGTLRVTGYSTTQQEYSAHFISGAGSLKERIGKEQLRDIFAIETLSITSGSASGTSVQFSTILWSRSPSWTQGVLTIYDTVADVAKVITFQNTRSGFAALVGEVNAIPWLQGTASAHAEDGKDGLRIFWDRAVLPAITGAPLENFSVALSSEVGSIDAIYKDVDYTNIVAFPSVRFEDAYADLNDGFERVANVYADGNVQIKNPPFLNTPSRKSPEVKARWPFTLIPFVYNKWLLTELFKKADFSIDGPFVEDEELSSLLIFNNHTLDDLQYTFASVWSNANVHDFTVKIQRHIPDITISDYINALRGTFGFQIFFSFQYTQATTRFLRDIIRSSDVVDLSDYMLEGIEVGDIPPWKGVELQFTPDGQDLHTKEAWPDPLTYGSIDFEVNSVADLDDLIPTINQVAYVRSLNQLWRFINLEFEEPTWGFIGWHFPPYTYEGNATIIATQATPLQDGIEGPRKMPFADYKVTCLPLKLVNDKYALRLTFYRGMQNDKEGNSYAQASSTAYNSAESDPGTFNYELQWDKSDKSLHPVFWQDYLKWRKVTQPVTVSLLLPLGKLISFRLWQKISLHGQHYVIENLRVVSGPTGLQPTELTLYTVDAAYGT